MFTYAIRVSENIFKLKSEGKKAIIFHVSMKYKKKLSLEF